MASIYAAKEADLNAMRMRSVFSPTFFSRADDWNKIELLCWVDCLG